MDPLSIFPEEISEYIFQYFNKDDILHASLVSKLWYRMMGRSRECMNKLRVVFIDSPATPDIKYYLASQRQYQHLLLYKDFNDVKDSAKTLRIMRSIVNKFSESLKTLVSNVDILRASSLPKLKELTFYCPNSSHHGRIEKAGLTSKVKHLERLTICCLNIDMSSIKALQRNIVNLDRLHSLKIGKLCLLDGMSSGSLKLKAFRLNDILYEAWIPNYVEFFSAQRPYLKFVDCTMSFEQIAFFMGNFPLLETFIARNVRYDRNEIDYLNSMDTLTYPTNESIMIFGYDGFLCNGEVDNLIAIFPKLIKTRKYMIKYINSRIMQAIDALKGHKIVKYRKYSRRAEF
jgi:hypothetical protein